MIKLNITKNKTLMCNILFFLTLLTTVISQASNQEAIQKKLLKITNLGELAYNNSPCNVAIKYNHAIELLNNIKSTYPRNIRIDPYMFFRLIRQVGLIDTTKLPYNLDGDDMLLVTLNRMNFESIDDVTTYLQEHNIDSNNIIVLDLALNNIQKITLKDMKKFPNLIAFNGSQNNIDKISSTAFKRCPLLRLLNLQYNQIKSNLAKTIKQFHTNDDDVRISCIMPNPIVELEETALNHYYTDFTLQKTTSNEDDFYYINRPTNNNTAYSRMFCTWNDFNCGQKMMNFCGICIDKYLPVLFEQETYNSHYSFLGEKFKKLISTMLDIVEKTKQETLLDDALQEHNIIINTNNDDLDKILNDSLNEINKK